MVAFGLGVLRVLLVSNSMLEDKESLPNDGIFLPLHSLILGLLRQLNLLILCHKLKQLSSVRAVGHCGLQRGLSMQFDHCLIP